VWWTNATGALDAEGIFQTRALHGEYAVAELPGGRQVRRTFILPQGAGRGGGRRLAGGGKGPEPTIDPESLACPSGERADAWAAATCLDPGGAMSPILRLAALACLAGLIPPPVSAEDASPPAGPTAPEPDLQPAAEAPPAGRADLEEENARTEARIQQEVETRLAAMHAQEQAMRKRARLLPHYEYLEDSYVDYFLPRVGPAGDRPLTFEAQAATHLFLLNQWDKVERVSSPGAMASVWSWDVSFILHLRMVQDGSAPVRPPSYVPSMHVQWFGLWKGSSRSVHELELEVGLTHHSNGQAQCSFVSNQDTASPTPEECIDQSQVSGSLRHAVNYRSGDFSTSYASAGMHYAFMTLGDDRYMISRYSLGGVYQQNFVAQRDGFLGDFPGGISADQAWMYGIHRARFEAQGRWHVGAPWTDFAGVLSATGSYELMWNTRPPIPTTRAIGEVSYTVDGLHGLGVFVRGSTGQDEMNVLYAAGRTNMVAFGLIWNTSPAVRYLFGEGKIPGA
jgi:hypothetical protein